MRLLFLCLIAGISLSSSAQEGMLDHFSNYDYRSIGPAGMSGRVTSIDVVRENPQIIFAATASGGLWRSNSGGIDWEPVFDDQPTQSIGSVAIYQKNPSIVWAGTGEGNPRNSHNSGRGIFKSIDGGDTWEFMGLKETKGIHRVIIHPDDPNIVYAAATGSAWGPNKERGVYMTKDGGENWEQILYTNDTTGCADLVMDPSNPNKLIASMWQHLRQPWTFTSGGPGSGLHITYDGGKTWKKLGEKEGLPSVEIGRAGLAFAPSSPNIVYALVESKKTGFYRSTDGGKSWQLRSTENIGNRPFYYADIFVDPKNENRIYNLYSVVSRSEDGGKTFQTILPYYGVHPDHHAWYIHPDDPDFMIDGNDGGINITYDRGKNWRFISNLPVGQFYHVNVDNDFPYNVYGGLQDNGSWVGPSEVWQSGGIRNHHWQEVLFGDGFDVMPRADDNRYLFAMYQGGNVSMVDTRTGNTRKIRPNHPEGKPLRFNWNAAMAQDPHSESTIYFGSQYVHRSKDWGNTWEIISPDLTTNDTTKQQQAKSGGLTIDATNAENFTTILSIAPSPVNKDVIWVGTDDGNIQLTVDGGVNWTNLSPNIKGMPEGAWVPFIEVSRTNEKEAFVVVNDYRRNNWKPYVFHTTDQGKTWKDIAPDDQVDGFVKCMIQDPEVPELLFMGTEVGLYLSIDYGKNWEKIKEFPSVMVSDLKIQERENDLVVGTFGRAIYVFDDITFFRNIVKDMQVLQKEFALLHTSDAWQLDYKAVNGARFGADGEWRGNNATRASRIMVWAQKPSADAEESDEDADEENEDETEEVDWKHLQVVVYDMKGDTIRNFKREADTSLNVVYWNPEMNGVHYPRWNRPKKDGDPPGGPGVVPGKYILEVVYGTHRNRDTITVHNDPRSTISPQQRTEQLQHLKKHMDMVQIATDGFNQLLDAQGVINRVQSDLEELPKEDQDTIRAKAKEISKEISRLQEMFMTPKGFEGYDHVTVRLNDMLYESYTYLGEAAGKPTENALHAYHNAYKKLKEIVPQINKVIQEDMKAFEALVRERKVDYFREMEALELD